MQPRGKGLLTPLVPSYRGPPPRVSVLRSPGDPRALHVWPVVGISSPDAPQDPGAMGAHRDDVGDAAVEVALVILDSDGPVLLDPLHGQWAVQLRTGRCRDRASQGSPVPDRPTAAAPTPPTSRPLRVQGPALSHGTCGRIHQWS